MWKVWIEIHLCLLPKCNFQCIDFTEHVNFCGHLLCLRLSKSGKKYGEQGGNFFTPLSSHCSDIFEIRVHYTRMCSEFYQCSVNSAEITDKISLRYYAKYGPRRVGAPENVSNSTSRAGE
jgi:hypothetical protein